MLGELAEKCRENVYLQIIKVVLCKFGQTSVNEYLVDCKGLKDVFHHSVNLHRSVELVPRKSLEETLNVCQIDLLALVQVKSIEDLITRQVCVLRG